MSEQNSQAKALAVPDLLVYTAMRGLSLLLALLPENMVMAFGSLLGQVACLLLPGRVRLCRRNLERAGFSPNLAETVFRHLGRMAMASLRLQRLGIEQVMARVGVVGMHNYHAARQLSERVLVVSAHMGFWEMPASVHAHLTGRPVSVVVRALENAGLDRFVEEGRARFGVSILEKSDGLRPMIRALRQGHDLGVMIDQKVRPSLGVPVRFFGEVMPAVPVASVVARAAGAVILPVLTTVQPDGRHRIDYFEPFLPSGDDTADTQRLTALLEEEIRRCPEQWFWVHDRWKWAGYDVQAGQKPASQ
ncbi:MAG: lysophospholipid acyltransferase family protein [Geothermobacteraceae bacterium]